MTAASSEAYTGSTLPAHNHTRGVLAEGITSGIIGALTVALWFFFEDLLAGHSLRTPGALGYGLTALLNGRSLAAPPGAAYPASMIFVYSVVHGVFFIGAGAACSALLAYARRNPGQELYAILMIATLGMWFTFLSMMLVGVVLSAVTIVDILIAHLLATLTMGAYFWRRYPQVIRRV